MGDMVPGGGQSLTLSAEANTFGYLAVAGTTRGAKGGRGERWGSQQPDDAINPEVERV